jgi:hypothetical protein
MQFLRISNKELENYVDFVVCSLTLSHLSKNTKSYFFDTNICLFYLYDFCPKYYFALDINIE